jgi:hypothetical protein
MFKTTEEGRSLLEEAARYFYTAQEAMDRATALLRDAKAEAESVDNYDSDELGEAEYEARCGGFGAAGRILGCLACDAAIVDPDATDEEEGE